MSQPCISVIIPVYKIEDYIDKCVESIVNQTHKNLDIILIDDSSPDNCPQKCDEWAKKDSRIRVFHKENEGPSLARNLGLKEAKGDYICCVDGDDWIDADMCEKSLKAMLENDADVAMWSYVREYDDRSIPKKIFDENIVFDEEAVDKQLKRRMIGLLGQELAHPETADSLCVLWGKLYKAQIIRDNNITIPDIRKIGTYEDGLFNLDIFSYAKKVIYINKNWYHYRKGNSISITGAYKPKLFEQYNRLFLIMREKIEANGWGDDCKQALNNRICLSMILHGLNVWRSQMSFGKKLKSIREILITKEYKDAFKTLEIKYFPLHWKVYFFCCKSRFNLLVLLIAKCISILK